MIPRASITEWSRRVPWPSEDQVEQDLLLSRLILEIAGHPRLGEELVFRGGTCLHKLHLDRARRYSEDLDYVRFGGGAIGPIFDAIREIADGLGMDVRTEPSELPKVFLVGEYESGGRLRVKVEMNLDEEPPARALQRLSYRVDSQWYAGSGEILTFQPEELVATKIRALYQRSKGRDLFDAWLAVTEMALEGRDIAACFGPYRPSGYTAALGESNLRSKVDDPDFRDDLVPLVVDWPSGYAVHDAAELVIREILSHL